MRRESGGGMNLTRLVPRRAFQRFLHTSEAFQVGQLLITPNVEASRLYYLSYSGRRPLSRNLLNFLGVLISVGLSLFSANCSVMESRLAVWRAVKNDTDTDEWWQMLAPALMTSYCSLALLRLKSCVVSLLTAKEARAEITELVCFDSVAR